MDFFRVFLDADESDLAATLRWTSGDYDLDLTLLGPGGTPLAFAYAGGGQEGIEAPALAAGEYVLVVSGWACFCACAPASHEVEVTVTPGGGCESDAQCAPLADIAYG